MTLLEWPSTKLKKRECEIVQFIKKKEMSWSRELTEKTKRLIEISDITPQKNLRIVIGNLDSKGHLRRETPLHIWGRRGEEE